MKTMKNLRLRWKQIASLLLMPIMIITCLVGVVPAITAQAEEEKVLVYASVPEAWENPCLWAWNDDGTNAFPAWPGGKMTADENNKGWYYCYIDKSLSGNIIVNANDGNVQTSDYKTNEKNAWITIAEDATAEVTNEQMTQGDLPVYVETEAADTEEKQVEEKVTETMITVHAKVPEDWLMPCIWAWSAPDGTNVFANWPGQELTLEDNGWYTYEIPDWVNSLIINGNLGEVQTTDVTIEAKDLWVTVISSEEFHVVYEEPTEVKTDVSETSKDVDATQSTNAPGNAQATNTLSPTIIVIIVLVILAVVGVIGFAVVKRKK